MNLKKAISIILLFAVIIIYFVPITAFADYELPQFMRIGIYYGSGAVKQVKLASDHGFLIGEYNGREFSEDDSLDEEELIAEVSGGKITVKSSSGDVIESGVSRVGIRPDASGKKQVIYIDGVAYRGGVDCIAKGDTINIINVVFLDHYLYGVVSREMSPSWETEALKAQAVCARNYAVNNLEKHAEEDFDLCSGVHCQAYSGIKSESDSVFEPVEDTTRQVMTYDGKIAQLYYSSSMGPTTENVENVWGSTMPYLISVDNSFEDTDNIPNGVWSGTLTCEAATVIMRNKGYDIGEVTDIKVLEYSDNYRALKMEVTGTNGSKIFEREACRTLFNTVTKSQMFTVSGNGEGGKSVPKVYVTDGTKTEERYIDKMTMLTAEGRKDMLLQVLCISDGVNKHNYEIKETESNVNTEFYFEGVGWGHGIGMSQYGAKGMAEAGYDYVDILTHYFPGTNLENAY